MSRGDSGVRAAASSASSALTRHSPASAGVAHEHPSGAWLDVDRPRKPSSPRSPPAPRHRRAVGVPGSSSQRSKVVIGSTGRPASVSRGPTPSQRIAATGTQPGTAVCKT